MRYGLGLAVLALILTLPTDKAWAFSGGDGTPENPYQITTPAELDDVRNYLTSSFILVNDIDLSGYQAGEGWAPISTFSGHFDGNNHVITNLTINRPTKNNVGLFGVVNQATIKNVGLTNVDINGKYYTGALIGSNTGVNDVTGTGSVTNCHVSGSVTGTWYTGGLIGRYYGGETISNCYSTAEVEGQRYVGGLVGWSSHNTSILASLIENSYSTGSVTGTDENVGGLVGLAGNITKSYSTSNVTGTTKVGGLVGTGRLITDCFAIGNVTGDDTVGGLVGYAPSAVKNSYSIGSVNGVGTNVNGLLGAGNSSSNANNYWDSELSGVYSTSVVGKQEARHTSQMKQQATFVNWDFTDTWTINEGTTYPWLKELPMPDFPDRSGLIEGLGIESDPYLISTPEQLDQIRYTLGACYKLKNDIDLSGYQAGEGWAPISTFSGHFDGNNHVITNLTINRPTKNNVGLFGVVNQATIKNVGLTNVDINGKYYTGALIGSNTGVNDVTGTGSVTNCHVSGSVTGTWYTGGLIGRYYGGETISNCYSTAEVEGQRYVGGLVGWSSHNTSILASLIENSYSTGSVTGTDENVGGLVGLAGNITKSYSTSNVTGTTKVGGLVGTGRLITDCFAIGNVTGDDTVGGLVGYAPSAVKNSYSIGSVNGVGTNVNGLLGAGNSSSNANNYWDSELSGIDSGSVVGKQEAKTTSQMKQQSTFIGWDFASTWTIEENSSYPYLRNLPKPSSFPEPVVSLNIDSPQSNTAYSEVSGHDIITVSGTVTGIDNCTVTATLTQIVEEGEPFTLSKDIASDGEFLIIFDVLEENIPEGRYQINVIAE